MLAWTGFDLYSKNEGFSNLIDGCIDFYNGLVDFGLNFTVDCQNIQNSKMNSYNMTFSLIFKSEQKCKINYDLIMPNIGEN